jgi:hypothetical protein
MSRSSTRILTIPTCIIGIRTSVSIRLFASLRKGTRQFPGELAPSFRKVATRPDMARVCRRRLLQ